MLGATDTNLSCGAAVNQIHGIHRGQKESEPQTMRLWPDLGGEDALPRARCFQAALPVPTPHALLSG